MNIICDGLELSDALLKVSKAISNKVTNPILEGIKLSAEESILTLSATDTELSIEKKIKAEVKEEGETVVPGKFITEFVKKLTNEKIELKVSESNKMTLSYTDSESSIQCYNSNEYPSFKKLETSDFFGISKKDFKTIVNKTIFAVALDDSRPILKGVLFDIDKNHLSALALDGYRLAKVKKTINSDIKKSIVIPAKSLSEMVKLIDDGDEVINIYIEKSYIMVDFGDTKVISRLIEGEPMNYSNIIAANYETIIVVKKSHLEEALERASLLSKVNNNFVKFDIKENVLQLTSNSEIGNVKENVSITLKGKDLTIAFNARYFIESLRVNTNEFVKICFNKATMPGVIVPIEEDEFLYLILPVRMI